MRASTSPQKNERLFKILAVVLILAGIAVRLIVYLQNRNLIIDESNVARNIYERGFIALLKPLSYEQYAPPVFLWLVKLSSILFGFGEMALKVYPFLCGIASVYIFYLLLKEYIKLSSIWLPLSFFVFSCIFIRYSTELKQYASDVLITCILVLLALKTDHKKHRPAAFAALWLLLGSIAIWASMPSVFVLAGVGVYYGLQALNEKNYKLSGILLAVYMLWAAQFLLYYLTILQPQADSAYLQNFHKGNFMILIPQNKHEWGQNWYNIEGLLVQIGGATALAIIFLLIVMIAGAYKLLKYNLSRGLLITLPLVCLFLAAAFNKFSLMPRVSLFGITLLIIISGIGYEYLVERSKKLSILLLPFALFTIFGGIRDTYKNGFKYEELTTGLDFMNNKKITAPYLCLYHASEPAYIYYTQIHPGKGKWAALKGADVLKYNTNYDSLAWQMNYVWKSKGPFAFIFTNETPDEFNICMKGLTTHLIQTDSLNEPYIKAAIFTDK